MNVLKITTTPTRLPMTSQRAKPENGMPDPEVKTIQNSGKLSMKSEDIKVEINTPRSRDSLGSRIARGLMRDTARAGPKAVTDATAQYSRAGNQTMQIQDGVVMTDIIKSRMATQTNIAIRAAFIPSVVPDILWRPAGLIIDYTPTQVIFDPQVREPAAIYIPDELHVNVEQYPKAETEYMGDPIHVPLGTNPTYEAAKQKTTADQWNADIRLTWVRMIWRDTFEN